MITIWKSVYEDCYEVSNFGEIKRKKKSRGTHPGRILRQQSHYGYPIVTLNVNGRRVVKFVHIIMAQAFLGERKLGIKMDDWQVNHMDGNKTNNHISNLEYVTHRENIAHAKSNGLYASGEKNGNSILTEELVKEIRKRAETEYHRTVAESLGISRATITMVVQNTVWHDPEYIPPPKWARSGTRTIRITDGELA